jgi:hypothetical protein
MLLPHIVGRQRSAWLRRRRVRARSVRRTCLFLQASLPRTGRKRSLGSVFEGKWNPFATGRWYAGGPNIYLRFSADDIGERRPLILHIVDIRPNEFHVRISRDGEVLTYRRVRII